MIRKLILLTFFLVCIGGASLAAEEKLVIGGSGALGDATDLLAKTYKQKQPADTIEVISESMSTTGGIGGVRNGRLTIGIVTRWLNDAEKKEGMTYRMVSRQPVAVGVNKALSVKDLSESQVCDIFSGKTKFWKEVGAGDTKILVLGRKMDDNDMKIFHDKMACFKNLQLSPDAVLLVRGNEVLDALNNRPGTVGISGAGAAFMERPNIKVVAVGGVAPRLEAVKTGKYKYYREIGFVTAGEPKGMVKRFLDFVTSPEAEKILDDYQMSGTR